MLKSLIFYSSFSLPPKSSKWDSVQKIQDVVREKTLLTQLLSQY